MIQKNYSALLFLFCGLLYSTCSFGQLPVANNDDFQIFVPQNCPTYFMNPVTNDTGSLDWNTVDLDPSQPGIQTQFSIPEADFQISNGYLSVNAAPFPSNPVPLQTVSLSYTVQDFSGNTSNVATITIILKRLTTYGVPINPSCESMNDGGIIVQLTSELNGPADIHLFKDNVEVGSYPLFQQMNPITGLTAGDYYYTITNCLGTVVQFSPPLLLYIAPSVNIFTTGTYQDYNNDGIVNVGDIINYQYSANNYSNMCTLNDVALMVTNNITPTGGSIASLGPGATDTTTLTGYIPITQYNINTGSVQTYFSIGFSNPGVSQYNGYTNTPLNIPNGIKLNAFIDSNNNGVQDNNELNYTDGNFSYQINSGDTHSVNTSTGTHYLYETNPANSYTLNYTINPNNSYCGAQYTVATPSYTGVTVANGSGIVTYNFAITSVPCTDIAVNLYPNGNPRPGFIYGNTIQYKNEGNQTITNGTITFTKDNAITILSVSDSGFVTTANGFTLDFYNLNPGETRTIGVVMQVPVIPTVSLGQLLTNSVSITPTDANAANNTAAITQTINGSFDPNEKTESHGGKILHSAFTANDYLTYTIRFENTGTAEAINIRVNDVLDAKLDETSIKMVASSHPYVLDRMGTNLNWRFDGINLPPSVSGDDITGHGYIVFQVKPKSGFSIGDIIPNKANIYFDFNPAIETNTCNTQFVSTLANDVFEANAFQYYPNPTSGSVTFSLKNNTTPIDTIEIMDVLGKTLLSKIIHYTEATIDLSSLSKGMYLAKVTASGHEKIVKISKD